MALMVDALMHVAEFAQASVARSFVAMNDAAGEYVGRDDSRQCHTASVANGEVPQVVAVYQAKNPIAVDTFSVVPFATARSS